MAPQPLSLPGRGGRIGTAGVQARGRVFRRESYGVGVVWRGRGFCPAGAAGIVCVEDVGEAPYRLHRVATQLVQAGAFAGVQWPRPRAAHRLSAGARQVRLARSLTAEVAQALADVSCMPLQVPMCSWACQWATQPRLGRCRWA